MTLRKEYPELLDDPAAKLVASHTRDLMEFLWAAWNEKLLPQSFTQSLGTVAYHAPCHLRAQKIALPARQLLSKVPDTEVSAIEQCSAVDGTWGMKAEYYELGVQYSKKLVRAVERIEAKHVASDCPLAAQRIRKENQVDVVHPVQLLAKAYGLDV